MDDTRSRKSWLEWLIVGSCAVFIFILSLSAVYDRSIRVLHAFQALTYVAVVILALRRSAWGYGAGCIIAAFWNWTNIVHTTFIANGLRELAHALQTGRVSRPDQLIAVVAAAAHFVLIGSCLVGYRRAPRLMRIVRRLPMKGELLWKIFRRECVSLRHTHLYRCWSSAC